MRKPRTQTPRAGDGKPSHKTARKSKGTVGAKTGTESKLFIGLDYELQGFMHIQPPRYSPEYRKMSVAKITNRIREDINELLARAYPTYQEEWALKYARGWYEGMLAPLRQDRWLDVGSLLDKPQADELCPGLWERLCSTDYETQRKAKEELGGLWQQRENQETIRAANSLANLAVRASTWLENLSVKCPDLIQKVAREFVLWPVNLGLLRRVQKGKDGKRRVKMLLSRREFAERYLKKLDVNANSRWPNSNFTGAEEIFPFRLAAVRLHTDLLMMKQAPESSFPKLTPWAKKLIALPEPLTTANADAWWAVAKEWLDEQWDANRRQFLPLIRHLKLDNDAYTQSYVRKQVIDDSLKKAFKALATPAGL